MKLILIFFLFASASISFAQKIAPINLITEEWPPYNYTENGKLTGFSSEIVQMIMEDLKISNQINVLPGARGMKILNSTPRSMYFVFIKTPERAPQYKWIGPFGEQAIYFYKKKGSKLQINSIEDAKKVGSICSRESGLIYSMLKEKGFKNIEPGVTAESIYLRAIHDRCDLAIGETQIGVKYWLNKSKLPTDSLVQTKVKLIDSPLYIIATKDIPDSEIALWQKSLSKIKKSDKYRALLKKYQI